MDENRFFKEVLIMENERAKLTPLTIEDYADLDTIAYHPDLWKLGMSNISSPTHLQEYMENAIQEKQNKLSYPFKIFDKQTNAVAGSTRYGNISFTHKRLEIGWTWLHPNFHGTGLNKACKQLLLSFAFETLGFNRVEIKTDVLNQQSRKAILKLGAKEEGIFRKHQVTAEGRVRDSIYFSIINDEWPEIKSTIFTEF